MEKAFDPDAEVSPMPIRLIAVLLLSLSFALPGVGAIAAGDAEEGARIARQWCASCHVIGPGQRGGDAAPPFVALANDPAKTETYLKNWIGNPHPPMPNFNLSRRAIDDLTAYIGTLSAKKGGRAVPHD
jgi:mono/diheme cytochrome c family protein